jgi:hypothetical protein
LRRCGGWCAGNTRNREQGYSQQERGARHNRFHKSPEVTPAIYQTPPCGEEDFFTARKTNRLEFRLQPVPRADKLKPELQLNGISN